MKKNLFFIVSILLIGLFQKGNSQNKADAILGTWLTGTGKGKVKIEKIGEKYHGKIVWLRDPKNPDGTPKVDKNNPDPALQKRPLMGLRVLRDFVYVGDNKWEEGKIYDPENGKDYSCILTLIDENTLNVRGYIGFSLIGRTQVWKRQAQ
ncbi:MAG: DUF2147 domain-containing protein [Bacteroidia bacterium]|nr:DUF2147 domain-containing protein [Bacteroidia bacterium]